jgi:hypothetical protein
MRHRGHRSFGGEVTTRDDPAQAHAKSILGPGAIDRAVTLRKW